MQKHFKDSYLDYANATDDELLTLLFTMKPYLRYKLLKRLLAYAKNFKRTHVRVRPTADHQFTVHTHNQHKENISNQRDRLIRLGIIRTPKQSHNYHNYWKGTHQ